MDPALPSLSRPRSVQTIQEAKIEKIFASTAASPLAQGDASTLSKIKAKVKKINSSDKKKYSKQANNWSGELITCCLTHMQDTYRMHLNRLRALKIIDTIVANCPREKIDSDNATHLTWGIVSCLHHFFVRLRAERGFMEWFRRRQARQAVKTYDKLLVFLLPEHFDTVFGAVITFLEEADLWDIEYFCSHLLQRVLSHGSDEKRCDCILELVALVEDSTLTNLMTSREILQVLWHLEKCVQWAWVDGRISTKMVELYTASLVPDENRGLFEDLEMGLASCLQAMAADVGEKYLQFMIGMMFKAILTERISGENLLHYGELVQLLHTMYTRKAAYHPLSDFTLPAILKTVASESIVYSSLGLRLLHSFIDRCNNKWQFETPRLFLRDTKYSIVVNEYRAADKVMFQRYREKLLEGAVACILKHGAHKIYIESLYICIALFLVEIPCAYTATAGLCLALTLQDLAITDKSLPVQHAHRIHATVIAVVSLVCYVHKADVLYDYVESIIEKRASMAPHLNPPLKAKYSYAQHHILWDDPQFLFEDWKVRYGLWRCFKARYSNVAVKKRDLVNMPLATFDLIDNL